MGKKIDESKQKERIFKGACPSHFVDYQEGCIVCDKIQKRTKPESKEVTIQ